MRKQLIGFALRWLLNSIGLWVAAKLFSTVNIEQGIIVILVAGLILSLINALIKPLVVILTLPAVLLSLGLFMIVINGFAVWLTSVFYSPLEITGFGGAVLAGIIIGLVNYGLSTLWED